MLDRALKVHAPDYSAAEVKRGYKSLNELESQIERLWKTFSTTVGSILRLAIEWI